MDIVSETKAEFRLRQWTKIIKECQASNLSAAAWCRQNNINIKSYYYWLRSAMGTGLLTLHYFKSEVLSITPSL